MENDCGGPRAGPPPSFSNILRRCSKILFIFTDPVCQSVRPSQVDGKQRASLNDSRAKTAKLPHTAMKDPTNARLCVVRFWQSGMEVCDNMLAARCCHP